jgi:hypothetical protein
MVLIAPQRSAVPQQSVTPAGEQEGNRDVSVVLHQQEIDAALIQHPALVLAQAVQGLVLREIEIGVGAEVILVLRQDGSQFARGRRC